MMKRTILILCMALAVALPWLCTAQVNLGDAKVNKLLSTAASELTISSGAVTVTQTLHTLDTEADAASDDLDTISGGASGQIAILRPANDGRTVVLKHETGNIKVSTGADYSLDDDHDVVTATFDGTSWFVLVSPVSTGTVTSVAVSGADGIEVDSGSPVTSTGTIALGVNKAAMLAFLDLEIGTDVQAFDAQLADLADGTLSHEAGGLEADVSAYDGLLKITGGASSAVTVTAAGEALMAGANVAAQRVTLDIPTNAEAVLDADTSTAGMGFVIDEDSFATDSATKVPTQQSVKAYVDTNTIGARWVSEWVPISEMQLDDTNGPTTGSAEGGSGSTVTYDYLECADAVSSIMYFKRKLRDDAVSGGNINVKIVWTSAVTTGNAVFSVSLNILSDDESYITTTFPISDTDADAAPSADGDMMVTPKFTMASVTVAETDVAQFVVNRVGGNGADTLAGAVRILGVMFQYQVSGEADEW